MVTRCHQHCGGATDQYIDRVVDIPVVLKMVISVFTREACVFLKSVTSELSWFHGWIDSSDSEGEVGIEIIGCGG